MTQSCYHNFCDVAVFIAQMLSEQEIPTHRSQFGYRLVIHPAADIHSYNTINE